MASRTWSAVAIVLLPLLAAIAIGAARPRPDALRSEHSQPAARVPAGLVAVTPEGKTFHDPNCPYIHGPKQMMPAAEAVSEGYTPCTRCMRAALGR
jgi:hypothetical protein